MLRTSTGYALKVLIIITKLLSDLKEKRKRKMKNKTKQKACETSISQETAVLGDGLILHALLHPVTVKQ